MKELKLTIELVPNTSWYINVRSNVPSSQWIKLRDHCFNKAGYKCEICKETGPQQGQTHVAECHEEFTFDDDLHTQTLTRLIALCPNCHKTKHPGLAQIKGEMPIVYKQLEKINGMDYDEINKYLDACFLLWKKRSKHKWTLNIDYIKTYLES
jgi:hypothetical protein